MGDAERRPKFFPRARALMNPRARARIHQRARAREKLWATLRVAQSFSLSKMKTERFHFQVGAFKSFPKANDRRVGRLLLENF